MTPQRREKPKTHLDASVVPVERALLARADALDEESRNARDPKKVTAPGRGSDLLSIVATEFRALAEELHWHG
jgi:hypothetical protein